MEKQEIDNMIRKKMNSFRSMKEKGDCWRKWGEMISMGSMRKDRDSMEELMMIILTNSKMSNSMNNKITKTKSTNKIPRCK